jgi:DNA-binding NarL/FixJ family response regulator
MQEALVVDDHPIVRDGIKDLLQKAFPSLRVTASSGESGLVHEICSKAWAFVVLDISFPRQNGIDVIKQARKCCPNIPIIVFSLFSEKQYANRALRAGATAYLSKDSDPQHLLNAVKTALRGGRDPGSGTPPMGRPILSDREIQVLTLYVKGMGRKEIAGLLRISEKTVTTYRMRLLQKLELRNVVDLIRYAAEEGLIE